jgi:hypothetical protein
MTGTPDPDHAALLRALEAERHTPVRDHKPPPAEPDTPANIERRRQILTQAFREKK